MLLIQKTIKKKQITLLTQIFHILQDIILLTLKAHFKKKS